VHNGTDTGRVIADHRPQPTRKNDAEHTIYKASSPTHCVPAMPRQDDRHTCKGHHRRHLLAVPRMRGDLRPSPVLLRMLRADVKILDS